MPKNKNDLAQLFQNFSKLTDEEREALLLKAGVFSEEDFNILQRTGLNKKVATHFIENFIGFYQLPLGVAVNYVIDGKDYIIPMAVEETSVIAAASKTAKWVRDHGTLTTTNLGWSGIGQIQLAHVRNFTRFKRVIEKNKEHLLTMVNQKLIQNMAKRGGGATDLIIRSLPRDDHTKMVVLHVLVNTCDAMGANIINQVCEYLKIQIEHLTQEQVGLCILSNLVDTKLTRAEIIIRNIDPLLGKAIEEASLFGQLDPYRAATNNKGIMNAIDPLLIATGNDWRAVEAGIHAYAASSGQYKSVSRWYMEGNNLKGELEAPIDVGIVGGVTKLHPVAQISLKILGVTSAVELARVLAAVGLVQNLAALRVLATDGIVQGHMKLHISNLILAAMATEEQTPFLRAELAKRLKTQGRITNTDVQEIMAVWKKQT